jgi:hypothetical protein
MEDLDNMMKNHTASSDKPSEPTPEDAEPDVKPDL